MRVVGCFYLKILINFIVKSKYYKFKGKFNNKSFKILNNIKLFILLNLRNKVFVWNSIWKVKNIFKFCV